MENPIEYGNIRLDDTVVNIVNFFVGDGSFTPETVLDHINHFNAQNKGKLRGGKPITADTADSIDKILFNLFRRGHIKRLAPRLYERG